MGVVGEGAAEGGMEETARRGEGVVSGVNIARYVRSQRHWVTRYLADRQVRFARQFIDGRDVLDVGCGAGVLEASYGCLARSFRSCDTIDQNLYDLVITRCNASYGLPFASDAFDTVFMLGVLEHLNRPAHALVEAQRVLRIGGLLVMVIPAGILWPIVRLLRPTPGVKLHAAFKILHFDGMGLVCRRWMVPGLFEARVYRRE